MSKLTRWTIGFVFPFCLMAGAVLQADVQKSNLQTHRDVDGQTYFALSLRPTIKEPAQRQRDILVLVDTSASQTGLFREDALEAVDTIVSGLRQDERIHIMAVDLEAKPMTTGFCKAGSDELKAGLANLKARTPLGATDMVGGIETAITQFQDKTRARSIIYVGDGMSQANLPSFDEFEPLVEKLVANRVSVNSYAVGIRCNLELLAVLANNSGGSIFIDGPAVTAQDAGVATLKLARGAVVWPIEADWSEAITQSYPTRIPPMRFDRTSVLIGTMVGKNTVNLNLKAELYGKTGTLKYSLTPNDTTATDDFAMVSELVGFARKTDGLMLSLLGNEGLDQARRMFRTSSAELSKLGKQALVRGDQPGGINLLREALRRDPGNAEAKALLKSNTAVRATSTKGIALQFEDDGSDPFADPDDAADPFGGDDVGDVFGGDDDPAPAEEPALEPTDVEPVEEPIPAPVAEPAEVEPTPAEVLPENPTEVPADLVAEPAPVPGEVIYSPAGATGLGGGVSYEPLTLSGDAPVSDADLLMSAEEERELMEAMLRAEVRQALLAGRESMRSDPAGVIEDLKNLRESIIQSPDLSSSVRAELLGRLAQGLRTAAGQRIIKDRLDEAARANLAELEARRRLMAADQRQQQVIQQYVDQVNAYLDEGRFALAEEVALQAREEAPHTVAPTIAHLRSSYIGNYTRSRATHELSARNFVDTLHGVELAHVPFPDDEPIVYPPADEWGPLSERRKAAYSQFDLGETGPAERRISTALQGMLKEALSYEDTPLSDVVSELEDTYDLEIQFDTQALEDESIQTSDAVSIDVGNISLRSALRLMLRSLDLTYVIDNEVLMITSKAKAEETLVTKVYPVGDLVMPINSMMMMGGGMMGGMGMHGRRHDGRRHDGRHGRRHDGRHGRHGRRHDGRHGRHGRRHDGRHGRRHDGRRHGRRHVRRRRHADSERQRSCQACNHFGTEEDRSSTHRASSSIRRVGNSGLGSTLRQSLGVTRQC